LDDYINNFENDFYGNISDNEIKEISEKIYKHIKIDILMNSYKYIYDGLLPQTDLHNKFIDKFLSLHNLITKYIEPNKELEQKINDIKQVRKESIEYFEKIKSEK
jgi:hypothetical protein